MSARIMIVEDERIVALDLKTALEYLGYEIVKIASKGKDAIDFAEKLKPDLILMDINLQDGIDGTEAALQIREKWRLPVVFLTAYAEEKTLNRAELCFPYGYLLKPFELRELEATVRMALARRKSELQIEQAEERLRLAVDAASLNVWEWEKDLKEFNSQGQFESMLAAQPILLKEDCETFLQHFEESDRLWIARALENGEQINSTLKMKLFEQPAWIDLHAKAYPSTDDGPRKVIGVIRDVADRRLKIEQLGHANNSYKSVAEGILVLGATRKIISCNPAFTVITGFDAKDVIDKDPDDFLHVRRHSDAFYSLLGVEQSRYWQGEIACLTAEKTVFPAWQQVCFVLDNDGSISNYVVAISDISALRRAEADINHLAFHDALTGLGNRHLLESRLGLEMERARETGSQLGVYLLDLDGFKCVNDSLGHVAGDELLKTVAVRIQEHLRATDIAIRLGGDEFVVIAPDMFSQAACVALAEKLLSEVRNVISVANEKIRISASIGIAMYPQNANDIQSLILAADSAMYNAKKCGKNKYSFFSVEMVEKNRDQQSFVTDLVHGFEAGEFEIYYQPILDIKTNVIVAFEALLRWNNPMRGIILPNQFFEVAEETGNAQRIGEWLLKRVCMEGNYLKQVCGNLPKATSMVLPEFKICLNVSAKQLTDENFITRFESIVSASGFPAQRLEVELTENTIQQIQQIKKVVKNIKNLGAGVTIDNFGTGFTSLSLMKNLAIDRIKIDRSFIQTLPRDPVDTEVVKAISLLAKSLKLKLAVEGVETPDQLEFVTQIGCDQAQGFLFSPPISLQELPQFIENVNYYLH